MRVPTTKLQNSFGKYLKHVLKGTEVIITKNGKGVAKLNKYTDHRVGVINEEATNHMINKYRTYEEFIDITEKSDCRYELIGGQIYLLASPSHDHQDIIREINGQMYNYFSDKPCDNYTHLMM